jgi:hypothetical protein
VETITTNPSFDELARSYRPPEAVAEQLRDKSIVCLVGPTAVGKSTIIQEIVRERPNDFHAVQTLTTRPPSNRDDGLMRHIPHDTTGFGYLRESMKSGNLVQIKRHDTTGYYYATELSDYTKPYNLLATLSSEVGKFRSLPFGYKATVGIAANPKFVWIPWLQHRFPTPDTWPEAQKRLAEARNSLDWLLHDSEAMWVENIRDDNVGAVKAAHRVIGLVSSDLDSATAARGVGERMYAMLPQIEEYFQEAA